MINVERLEQTTNVKIIGTMPTILSELEICLRQVRKALIENEGEEAGKEIFDIMVANSKMSEEERKAIALEGAEKISKALKDLEKASDEADAAMEVLDNLLRGLAGGIGEADELS